MATATPEPPTPNVPTEERAKEGYRSLVRVVTRQSHRSGGMVLGDRRDVLLGLTLNEAAPVFIDPFLMSQYRNLLVCGDEGSGKRFFGELLRLRSSWVFPKDVLRVVDGRPEAWTPEARPRLPWRFPEPHRRGQTRRGLVLTTYHPGNLTGHDPRDPIASGEYPCDALPLLRNGEGPERLSTGKNPLLTDAESEWIPKARVASEAGYTEGMLVFGPWRWKLPIALVASTDEVGYLTSCGF